MGKKPSAAKWGVAFEPKKIVPGTPYPDDFMDFWRSAIAKYDREVTEPIRVTEVKRTAASVMYELRIPSTQGRYVWGYFSEPVDKTKGPFPLHVNVPGAGPSSWGCTMDGNAMNLKVNVHYYDPVVLKGEPHKSAKCLAVQFAPEKIAVNCVTYGGVEGRVDEGFKKRYAALCPMERMMKDDETVGSVDFLLSDKAVYITGQNIVVDGGWGIW